MANWYEYPQEITKWNKDVDYFMFVDENGSSGRINSIFKKITNNIPITDDEKYFTITGCIFTRENMKKYNTEIKELKNKYWKDGKYFDSKSKEERYVCFHSREIRRHDNAFNDALINHLKFTEDLTILLKNTNCKIISITIDLENYIRQGYLFNIYETAFDFLLERYIYATGNHKKGVIMLEARGKSEDKKLLKHIYDVINVRGRKNISTAELNSKIVGIYFNPKWGENYNSTYVGLEIVDLFSYPIHQYVKYGKSNQAFEVLKDKIDGYPNFMNKGIKIFPNIK